MLVFFWSQAFSVFLSLEINFPLFKGLEITANKNFGGGNTAWEEEKLAKYARR